MFVGSELGVIEARYQPMKIAAAEAQWTTCQPCSFSLFQIGGGNNDHTPTQILGDPAPAVAAGHELVERQGDRAHPLQAQYAASTGRRLRAERVHPVLVDAGDGLPARLLILLGLWGLWLIRRKKLASSTPVPVGGDLGGDRCRS